MSSDEDYLFDETDDRDSGNESPENSEDEDEEDWGMDIGLGMIKSVLLLQSWFHPKNLLVVIIKKRYFFIL